MGKRIRLRRPLRETLTELGWLLFVVLVVGAVVAAVVGVVGGYLWLLMRITDGDAGLVVILMTMTGVGVWCVGALLCWLFVIEET
jgi:ABC-type dipeptide/oligopeptide/nickel transport system permease component